MTVFCLHEIVRGSNKRKRKFQKDEGDSIVRVCKTHKCYYGIQSTVAWKLRTFIHSMVCLETGS
jgi:hypothetical protein